MQQDFTLEGYDYHLPKERIAQKPAKNREESRLMVVDRTTSATCHKQFTNIEDYIPAGDMLVLNNTRVFPARLHGTKETGGKAEIFLLGFPEIMPEPPQSGFYQAKANALIKSSKKPKTGSKININQHLFIIAGQELDGGARQIVLHHAAELGGLLKQTGQIPLPPYIVRENGSTDEDQKRYQTVYADKTGAVAAPTAGLHFSQELLARLAQKGVYISNITLHVGYGTFAPVRADDIMLHNIHREYLSIKEEAADKINQVKRDGGNIWAVGTTTVRALEFAAAGGVLKPTEGWCDLYILPGYRFRMVDHLITNFHLPKSSLMFLVSALCGRENLLKYYGEAIKCGYRFYSYGDAMLII